MAFQGAAFQDSHLSGQIRFRGDLSLVADFDVGELR